MIGFAIMLWFLIGMFRSALRRTRPAGFVSSAKLSALVACAGVLVHGLVDFNLHVAANAALFYVLAALASAEEVEGASRNVVRREQGPVLVHDITLN